MDTITLEQAQQCREYWMGKDDYLKIWWNGFIAGMLSASEEGADTGGIPDDWLDPQLLEGDK